MNNFGSYVASNFLAPKAPLTVTTGVSWNYIRIINNSSYQLSVNMAGMGSMLMAEFYLEDIQVPRGYNGQITITPQQNVSSIGHSVSNLIIINAYQQGELSRPQSQPLAQPAVTTTATGKPIFSATIGFGSTATIHQTLNIFNPATSGVIATFHAARIFTSSSQLGNLGFMTLLNGADLNLATPVSAVCHTVTSPQPISAMHCTSEDAVVVHGGTDIEGLDTQANVTQDFLTFPDAVLLYPGNNLRIVMVTNTDIGQAVRLTMKWTEDVVTPIIPVPGGVNVANSIKNDGNVAGVQIVEATVLGDGSSDVIITNDAQMTLGDVAHPGKLTIAGASNPAIDISSATQGIKFVIGTLTRLKLSGPYTVNNGATQQFAHNLGVTPDIAFPIIGGATNANFNLSIDVAGMSSTTVGLATSNATPVGNVYLVALKF